MLINILNLNSRRGLVAHVVGALQLVTKAELQEGLWTCRERERGKEGAINTA